MKPRKAFTPSLISFFATFFGCAALLFLTKASIGATSFFAGPPLTAVWLLLNSVLPFGLTCLILSWRMARGSPGNSDTHDAKEFLLGSVGFIAFVFGWIFAMY